MVPLTCRQPLLAGPTAPVVAASIATVFSTGFQPAVPAPKSQAMRSAGWVGGAADAPGLAGRPETIAVATINNVQPGRTRCMAFPLSKHGHSHIHLHSIPVASR